MKTLKHLFLLLFAFTFILTSCDPDKEKTDPQPQTTLTANAGPDQNVQTGQTVTLNGSGSKDGENKTFTYAWAFTQKPTGSQATLTNAATATPTFVPDLPGDYELELTIGNGTGSHKDKVLIKATTSTTALVLGNITVKTVLEDRIADPNLPDYLVNASIGVDAELTVKPGVNIAFAEDAHFSIDEDGVIIAKGEANKKIRFTGKQDQKGYWAGIMIYSNSSANEFNYTEVLNAGSTDLVDEVKAAITVSDGARITIKNSEIAKSNGYGLYLRDGSILYGFAANKFDNNTAAPIKLTADNVPMLDAATLFTANHGIKAIEVNRSSIQETKEVVWQALQNGFPYRLVGLITANSGWKLSPGLNIEVSQNNYIEVGDGYLNAVGTADKSITITGVDQTAGSWNGIIFYSRNSQNKMEHVNIKYAGGQPLNANIKSSITLSSASSLQIKNSKISFSGGYGIHVYGDEPTLNADAGTVNQFTSNALNPIFYNK
ncbi:MAG: PKD domain-containing protein [Adhaeribacter sp.]